MADAARCIIILLTYVDIFSIELNSYSYAWLNNNIFLKKKMCYSLNASKACGTIFLYFINKNLEKDVR